jgi:uncharacterized FAD-dependent dehydrogenase
MRVGIIGAGVSGLFCAIELINKGFDGRNIIIFDKGKSLDNRVCFVDGNTPCKKCKVCSITHGVGGAGSFSDSKLNFDTTGRVGGDMAELITEEEITEYLKKTYEIYKQFGIEEFQSKAYGKEQSEQAKEILEVIKNNPKLDIGECITIHLGTENSRIIYGRMIEFLKENNVEIRDNTEVMRVTLDDFSNTIYYTDESRVLFYEEFEKIVVAMGRSGNKLVKSICNDNVIMYSNGRVDMGFRVECPNEVMQKLNESFYECKIYFKGSYGDTARMFCTNPSGFVTVESYPYYGKKIFTANGHAYANKKSNNTNFAILVSRSFNEDCPDPLEDYVYPLIQATNSLGKGSVILQSLKDIKLNRRSTEERIQELNITPTANVYKGDLTSVVPHRTLTTILEFIEELDKIAEGINGDDTLFYGMEAKFHSNKVVIDKYGQSSNPNIYFIGDCSGWCRGLTTASSMGILCAESILER